MSVMNDKKYLDITYSDKKTPRTQYPYALGKELVKRTGKTSGKFLDLGCGRGEYLDVFFDMGFDVTGFDLTTHMLKDHKSLVIDLESEDLPKEHVETYDLIFTKPVIEHMKNPMRLINTAFEALVPGGSVVIMTPAWEYTYWGPFYCDHTHVTPWTKQSLAEALLLAGFEDIQVEHFFQLPFLWKYPSLKPLVKLFRKLPIPYKPNYDTPLGVSHWFNILVRFSKEPMLFSIARKNK